MAPGQLPTNWIPRRRIRPRRLRRGSAKTLLRATLYPPPSLSALSTMKGIIGSLPYDLSTVADKAASLAKLVRPVPQPDRRCARRKLPPQGAGQRGKRLLGTGERLQVRTVDELAHLRRDRHAIVGKATVVQPV